MPATVGPVPLALDKTDCAGRVLDDMAFDEPVVRDDGDESFGALSNPAMRPLGGGEGYPRIVARQPVVVRTADELRAALAAAAARSALSTVYVDDTAEIDLSYCEDARAGELRRPAVASAALQRLLGRGARQHHAGERARPCIDWRPAVLPHVHVVPDA